MPTLWSSGVDGVFALTVSPSGVMTQTSVKVPYMI